MTMTPENKCAMCGKDAIISDGFDKQQEHNSASRTMIVEQIDGSYYTFDTQSCALMFKKFNALYGSNFADE